MRPAVEDPTTARRHFASFLRPPRTDVRAGCGIRRRPRRALRELSCGAMPEFTKGEAKSLAAAVERFTHAFETRVVDVLSKHFRGAQPPEIIDVREQLSLLAQALTMKTKPVVVHDAQN